MVRPLAIAMSNLPLAMMLACAREPSPQGGARNLVLVTIDTLRADHLRTYGYSKGHTPFINAVASWGAVFERAYAAAPITLPSHATILTGRYPPGHGSRDNGLHVNASVPTLATELEAQGFTTAAFVAAFPLDHQFGLDRGFEVYNDRLGRGPDGKPLNERPASQVVDEAIAWLQSPGPKGPPGSPDPKGPGLPPNPQSPAPSPRRFFLWVHVFEPHAPYGAPGDRRPVLERYDSDIAAADGELARLLPALNARRADTAIIVTSDHGEAFGEHGEYAHSIFVYDTTLRVPLVIYAPGMRPRQPSERHAVIVSDPVSLADVAPTAMRLLGFPMKDVDGIDLSAALSGGRLPARELYAESFAPLVEFGWAPLRSVRAETWKYIAAPKPELYDLASDPSEQSNVAASKNDVARRMDGRVARYSTGAIGGNAALTPEAGDRLRALGYAAGNPQSATRNPQSRADPKDRRELAARIAQVTSGELSGDALVSALEGILKEDPRNAQARLRLGYARLQAGDCRRAEPELQAAIAGGLPSADAYLGLAQCLGARRDFAAAERALNDARRVEPSNPVVTANLGILKAAKNDFAGAIESLSAALQADPDLHEARFNLALAYAKAGRRGEAIQTARDLLARLPSTAPQRAEIERLIKTLQ